MAASTANSKGNRLTTTRGNLTSHQIRALETEAFAAGDPMMGYICRVALGAEFTAAELNDNSALDHSEQLEIEAMTRDEALDRVVAAITDAEAAAS